MNRIIILEDQKFDWTQKEIDQAIGLFNSGIKPTDVAEIMNEKVINIGLLFIHLADKGKIKKQTND
ncbi:hypothetical protein [Enterococcus sp. DIV0212c]|uniref:hypothetical protein n=1 Tax=Enterococcus sp. DIV0212c TaxID=2230867 RepID=UPI001A9AABE5|nr:hypothetical protein [Enterococcus sp. DIV0212c]MBO1354013.1 hypothetical protein [Enterococcus sp. DIV0212c]